MLRHIVHLSIPDFCATLEGLRRPESAGRPMVLAEPGPRSVIQGVNGAARSEGLRPGMALVRAQHLCRRLIVVPPDSRHYRERHENLLESLIRFSPLVEGTLPGHYFIDLTGTKRLWGPFPDTACRMNRYLSTHHGVRAKVGLAANKLTSQVAASCVPPGDLSCIFPGAEKPFLEPLPVTLLPGVGPRTAARLGAFNIERVGQLTALPPAALCNVFGRMGKHLLEMAQGIDPSPVIPWHHPPKLCVACNLEQDEIDRHRLEAALFRQSEEAGWWLRRHNRCPGRFTLEVRYADGVTVRESSELSFPTVHLDRRLFQAARSIFQRIVQRRLAVRRIILEFHDFFMPSRQLPLFPWEESALQEDRRLQGALDHIRRRFGRKAVSWGKAILDHPPSVIGSKP